MTDHVLSLAPGLSVTYLATGDRVPRMSEPETIPANERSVRTGGLMRCCLGTLAESTEPSDVGTVLSCAYESDPDNGNMIVALDGVWEWNRPGSFR